MNPRDVCTNECGACVHHVSVCVCAPALTWVSVAWGAPFATGGSSSVCWRGRCLCRGCRHSSVRRGQPEKELSKHELVTELKCTSPLLRDSGHSHPLKCLSTSARCETWGQPGNGLPKHELISLNAYHHYWRTVAIVIPFSVFILLHWRCETLGRPENALPLKAWIISLNAHRHHRLKNSGDSDPF